MAKLVLIKGTDAITKSIKSVETRGKALDNLIHLTACSILAHVHEHREVSLANKLLNALPKSGRKNALIAWFEAYGEMLFDGKDKEMKFCKDTTTEQDKAELDPFWKFVPEPAYHALDLNAAVAKLVKEAIKRNEAILAEQKKNPNYSTTDKIDADTLKGLQALVKAD